MDKLVERGITAVQVKNAIEALESDPAALSAFKNLVLNRENATVGDYDVLRNALNHSWANCANKE